MSEPSATQIRPIPAPIGAVILAAGLSRRMGRPKMALPWGNRTVIGQVAWVLIEAGLSEIVAVLGGARQQVERALAGLPVRTVFNPLFEQNEMTTSLQAGLRSLPSEIEAALVVLGDQPQIQTSVVASVLQAYATSGADLVVPSYRMRRGHPWLVTRSLWEQLYALERPNTLRDFLEQHADAIQYLTVDDPGVIKDLDTPADYERERPGDSFSDEF